MPETTPRQVADKSVKGNLSRALQMSLAIESGAVRHNTQSFNNDRYRAVAEIDDYETLKDRARAIKEAAIENLPELLQTLERIVLSRRGHFYLARTGQDASEYITSVCQRHNAKLVVKAKSITSEEIKLNHYLEAANIEVAETDLAEFILQVADEQPSHIVAPAIHRSRERISELFKLHFGTTQPLDTGEDLTKFARDRLRDKFLTADVGISGANAIAADSGTLLLVESEGNIRMVTTAPSVHIALAGIEKVVPTRDELTTFLELLAPSGTGQALTSYTHLISPPLNLPPFSFDGRPKRPREFHLVLIDNGRLKMRSDPVLREALYCIRCSACLNSCANFQAVGGHAFGGETYSGGVGGSWEAGTGDLTHARFSELCTGCSRCRPQCPVRIDIPWLNEVLSSRLNSSNRPGFLSFFYRALLPGDGIDHQAPVAKQFFAHYHILAKWGSRLAPASNWMGKLPASRWLSEITVGLDRRRPLPAFHRETLEKRFVHWRKQNAALAKPLARVLLFADIYTNHTRPTAGMAIVRVLNRLGVNVQLSDVLAEGRAALSQGLLKTAQRCAHDVANYLAPWIGNGFEILVVEPSVLALFKHDYSHLFVDNRILAQLREHSHEPLAYLNELCRKNELNLNPYFDRAASQGRRVFYHSHCQQRTSLAGHQTIEVLTDLGFDVATSRVECCGMAGSFGYKRDFYEVSMRVGEDLLSQIHKAEQDGPRLLLASGVSCHEQIQALTGREVLHPMELLEKTLNHG